MISAILAYFTHPLLLYTLTGIILSTSSIAIIGNFWFLQKKSLISDAIAHALLPGICIGFLCAGSTKNTLYLTIGGAITGAIALLFLEQIHTHTKIKKDAAIAMVISTFLGSGLFLLTYIQQGGSGGQAGLKLFLFGHTATLMNQDILIFIGLSCLITSITILFFKPFTLLSFDPLFVQTIGWPLGSLKLLLQGLTILTILAGVRAMGTLLIASILIIPAATARFWSSKLSHMVLFSVFLATCSTILGTCLSYFIADLPTGPSIVLCMITLALLSFFVAPQTGLLPRKYKRYKYQEKILIENVLKLLYQLGEEAGAPYKGTKKEVLLKKRPMLAKQLNKALKKLSAQGLINRKNNDTWVLTSEGRAQGKHILSLHTLWETYLMRYLTIQADHVHDDAEAMEHLLTPRLEAELRALLKNFNT